MKKCCTCNTIKPLIDFNKKSSTKDGFERYCKQCHRERNKKHYQANKQSYIHCAGKWRDNKRKWWFEYKSKLSCSTCGESRHWCLDFHHTDPSSKEGSLSELVTRNVSRERILEEVSKCIVVCRNCHADIHYQQLNFPQALK